MQSQHRILGLLGPSMWYICGDISSNSRGNTKVNSCLGSHKYSLILDDEHQKVQGVCNIVSYTRDIKLFW